MILGIDEVGRGPWAGPLVVGAAVLGCEIEGLTDSKKLTAKRREALNSVIYQQADSVALGWVSSREVDSLGLSASLRLATKRAVQQVKVPFHEIIIDGTVNFLADTPLSNHVTTMKKADMLVPSVSAAAIAAKVARDRYMAMQDEVYPGYNFASHVGYGTLKHRLAIEELGASPIHRLSFGPLKKYAEKISAQEHSGSVVVDVGHQAEQRVTDLLEGSGHVIVAKNWRTRWCEVDVISILDDTIYFTEVKYRKTSSHGGGLSAVDSKKYRQMMFAAEYFVTKLKFSELNPRLAVASVSGVNFDINDWIVLD